MNLTRFVVVIVITSCSSLSAGDWPRFRGPNGTGISSDQSPTPTEWSSSDNIAWKTALSGPGVSSPIVVGDRVFVTCYSGYGLSRQDPGDIENLKRHLVCVDANTGELLWDKSVPAAQPEDPYSGMGVPSHGYASHTPTSDGERVYVFFGKSGALAFDLDGNQLWQTELGKESDPRRWGSSSSPILYGNLLVVVAAAESQAIVGLNKATGEEIWRQEARGFDNVWGTPALAKLEDDRIDLVLGVPYEIWGFNPDTGKLRWYSEAMQSDQFQSSVVVADGVAYAIEGRGGGSIAVRAGGKGNVTDSHVIWTGRDSARFGSPIIHDGRMYFISSTIANCIDVKTGDRAFPQQRLRGGSSGGGGGRGFGGRGGGSDYSSPVIADGKLYYLKGSGETHVMSVGESFEQIAVNRLTDDDESFGGTPAISNGRLFIRSDKHLYCVAED